MSLKTVPVSAPVIDVAKEASSSPLAASPLAARSPAGEVRASILGGLYSGRYRPGQRLVEATLVRELGHARGYVREALQRLEAEGIVVITPFRGASVRQIDPIEARDIDLAFLALYALAARQAAARIDEGENRSRLAAAFERLHSFDETQDFYSYALARERFIRLIIEISGNREVERLCPVALGHLVWMQDQPPSKARHLALLAGYRATYKGVSAGDPRKAEAAVRKSMERLAPFSSRSIP